MLLQCSWSLTFQQTVEWFFTRNKNFIAVNGRKENITLWNWKISIILFSLLCKELLVFFSSSTFFSCISYWYFCLKFSLTYGFNTLEFSFDFNSWKVIESLIFEYVIKVGMLSSMSITTNPHWLHDETENWTMFRKGLSSQNQ